MAKRIRRTKIVATIGPASESPEIIAQLVDAGVNVFRLNFSHGTREDHGIAIDRIRNAAQEKSESIAILQDLQGPKIRVGALRNHEPIELTAGQSIRITIDPIEGDAERLSTSYEALPQDVRAGDEILLDDGRIQLKVSEVGARDVNTEVVVGGLLCEHKGMNLPNTPLSAPSLTKKDIEDLVFGMNRGVDYVALSFVRRAEDIADVRREMATAGKEIPVIAKIERLEALDNLAEIVRVADGVMVARGDLGVETSSAAVPLLQKQILDMTGRFAKPDITATQMLETMVANPRPSRAEATDVANAIFDGTDALMLSAETAVGRYPVEAVRTMAAIALEAEPYYSQYGRPVGREKPEHRYAVGEAAARAVVVTAREIGARCIVVFTLSGRSACRVSGLRPDLPILAFTPHEETCRRMALVWGVKPILTEFVSDAGELEAMAKCGIRESGLVESGDLVVMLTGTTDMVGTTNMMRIHQA